MLQAETLSGQRIVVVVDGWEADSLHPVGHYVRKLGTIGDKDTETEVLLIENDINTSPFTPGVHACVPPLPWTITASDWHGRYVSVLLLPLPGLVLPLVFFCFNFASAATFLVVF